MQIKSGCGESTSEMMAVEAMRCILALMFSSTSARKPAVQGLLDVGFGKCGKPTDLREAPVVRRS